MLARYLYLTISITSVCNDMNYLTGFLMTLMYVTLNDKIPSMLKSVSCAGLTR